MPAGHGIREGYAALEPNDFVDFRDTWEAVASARRLRIRALMSGDMRPQADFLKWRVL
jgi:hypothetical protein